MVFSQLNQKLSILIKLQEVKNQINIISVINYIVVQYNTVKPNLKGSAVLLRFRDSFGLKKAKIKKRKIQNLIYLSVYPLDSV